MATSGRLANRVTNGNAKWWTLVAACFALFMAVLDNLVVNVALPTISEDLSATGSELQWINAAYTLVFASIQITAGGLGDRFGRKKLFLFGVVLFTATSAAAALVNTVEGLIIARAFQGLGAAFIMPLSLSLISNAFPPEERGKALGIWSGISISGLALGPIVGGFIVEYFAWQWIFLVNVPVGIAAYLVTSAVVTESRDMSGRVATDIPGTLAVTGAIAALTWSLIEAGERGWGDNLIWGGFILAAILLVAFIRIELRTERPMIPLGYFRSGTFSGANIDAFFMSFFISGLAFSLTLYFQNVHGYSPIRAGMINLPFVITMMVLAPISGSLVNRIGTSRLVTTGMVITGASAFMYLRTASNASYLDVLPAMLVMGAGMALIFAPMTTAVMNSVSADKSGIASAINGSIREMGFAFGVATLGTIMNTTYRDSFNQSREIEALRDPGNPAAAPMSPVLDEISDGINYGGQVIFGFPGVPPDIAATIQRVSSDAFVVGMHRSFIITGVAMIAVGLLSLLLINDRVAEREPGREPDTGAAVAPVIGD